MSRLHINKLVKVLYAPRDCQSEWSRMAGNVGFIADLNEDGFRAKVQAITVDAQPGLCAWIDAAALQSVEDAQWTAIFETYQRRLNAALADWLRCRLATLEQTATKHRLTIDQVVINKRAVQEAFGQLPL